MYQVPWKEYSEEEIQQTLSYLFKCKGYNVYNAHKADRRGEMGADLECTRPAEAEKILVSVKKKPQQKDILQLETLAKRDAKTKIYVYVEEPSASFKEAMSKKSEISFWDSEKLTSETFRTDLRFYLFLIIENNIERTSYRITFSFCKLYFDLEKGKMKIQEPAEGDVEMMNLLWNAKDRSASLHKSLRTLQEIYENTYLTSVDYRETESIVNGFLKGLFNLHINSLKPLEILFKEFMTKYPNNFAQFCLQTKDRSNWVFFFTHFPELLPGNIIKSFETEEKEAAKLRKFFDKSGATPTPPETLGEILADISRILANGAYWLEDVVDDLHSIAFFGKWEKMREKTPKWLRLWENERGLGYQFELDQKKTTDKETLPKMSEQKPSRQPPRKSLVHSKGKRCFVLMPFKANFRRLYENHIRPVLENNGFKVMKSDDIYTPTVITDDIKTYIGSSDLVLADVTNKNPNVLYELGLAHAIGKETIIITQNEEDIPSDFRHLRYFEYDDDEEGWKSLRECLDKVTSSTKTLGKQ
ncbi:MAG: restriction endonuclease [Candidatus Bathyarchaeia archaeon]